MGTSINDTRSMLCQGKPFSSFRDFTEMIGSRYRLGCGRKDLNVDECFDEETTYNAEVLKCGNFYHGILLMIEEGGRKRCNPFYAVDVKLPQGLFTVRISFNERPKGGIFGDIVAEVDARYNVIFGDELIIKAALDAVCSVD